MLLTRVDSKAKYHWEGSWSLWRALIALTVQASAISSLPRERLEKLFNDSVRKLKAKERELASVLAGQDRNAAPGHETAKTGHDDSMQQLEVGEPHLWARLSGSQYPWK